MSRIVKQKLPAKIQVSLPVDIFERLCREAEALYITPATLARQYVSLSLERSGERFLQSRERVS